MVQLFIKKLRRLNHNVYKAEFGLKDAADTPTLLPGQHLTISATRDGGAELSRPYTPVVCADGVVEVVFKLYERGRMSAHLRGLRAGESVRARPAPLGWELPAATPRRVSLVAGGTGVTPLLALLRHYSAEPGCEVRLLFVNHDEHDEFLRPELRAFGDAVAWRHGRLTGAMLEGALGPADGGGGDSLLLACGPPGFCQAARQWAQYRRVEVLGAARIPAGIAQKPDPAGLPVVTRAELRAHRDWTAVHGLVIDAAAFVAAGFFCLGLARNANGAARLRHDVPIGIC